MKIKNLFLAAICMFSLTAVITSCGGNDDDNTTPAVQNQKFTSSLSINAYKTGVEEPLANSIKDYFSNELSSDAVVTLNKDGKDYVITINSLNGTDKVTKKLKEIQSNPSKLNSVVDGVNGIDDVMLDIYLNTTTVFEYEYQSCYSAKGNWQSTNGEKSSTLSVQSDDWKNFPKGTFTYDGEVYEGKVSFLKTRFIFYSNDDKMVVVGAFTNKDNNKITCDIKYNKEVVGTDIVFVRQ